MKDGFAVETSAPTSSPVGPSDAASVGKGSMAINDCDDPVSSACGATVYYSNCRTGRHTSIRCASCGAGCRINYCEEQFTEFHQYLDARKRNLNTDGPEYSISRTFEGQMRDFAEFLQLKSRTGFEITDDIEASCY